MRHYCCRSSCGNEGRADAGTGISASDVAGGRSCTLECFQQCHDCDCSRLENNLPSLGRAVRLSKLPLTSSFPGHDSYSGIRGRSKMFLSFCSNILLHCLVASLSRLHSLDIYSMYVSTNKILIFSFDRRCTTALSKKSKRPSESVWFIIR